MTRARRAAALAAVPVRSPASRKNASAVLAAEPATRIALAPEAGLLLSRAARAAGVTRAELVRRRLRIVLARARPLPRLGQRG